MLRGYFPIVKARNRKREEKIDKKIVDKMIERAEKGNTIIGDSKGICDKSTNKVPNKSR